MSIDDAEGLAERERARWMIDGKQWSQQTTVEFRIEDGYAYSVVGEHIGIGMRNTLDQTFASQATQIVGHLRRAVCGGEKAGDLGTQAPIGEAGHRVDGDAQSADQGHRARIPEAQGSGSLALLKRGQCDPLKERGRNGTAPGRRVEK